MAGSEVWRRGLTLGGVIVEDAAVPERVVPVAGGHVRADGAQHDDETQQRHPLLPPDACQDRDRRLDDDQEPHPLIHPIARAVQLQEDEPQAAPHGEVEQADQALRLRAEGVSANEEARRQ